MKIGIAKRFQLTIGRREMLMMFLGIVWAFMLSAYWRGVINHLPFFQDFTDEIEYAYFIIPILLALPILINKFCLFDYLFYFVLVLHYLSNYVFFPDNKEYLTENAFTCICCVYTFYFIGRIIDIDKMFDFFVVLSSICILITVFYYTIYAPENKNMDETAGYDNMYTAYKTLPHVAMLLWATLSKFKIWKALLCFLGIMFLLSCGTRGPLLCLTVFGIIYFFFFMNFKGAIFLKGFIILTAITIFINLRNIVLFLAKTFIELKLSSRIMEKVLSGDMANDTYRGVLRNKLYAVLDSGNHFWGFGLFGSNQYDIAYPHYLPLDFFFTYGYFVGSALLLLLAILICYALWISRGTTSQIFILFLCSLSIVKLMFSATFISEPFFFMLIGICMRQLLIKTETYS